MALPEFDKLLMQIRDGERSLQILDRAQVLLRTEDRLPEELRQESLHDDPSATAVAFLALLGHDDGFGEALMGALSSELHEPPAGVLSAGPVGGVSNRPNLDEEQHITAEMVEALERDEIPIAEAVRFEADSCEVVSSVLTTLSLDTELPISAAIRSLSGSIDIASNVMETLEINTLPVAQAVVHEADEVEVTPQVLSELHIATPPVANAVRVEAGTVDVVDTVMQHVRVHSIASVSEEVITPANRPMWRFVGLAAVAAMFLGFIGFSFLSGSPIDADSDANGFQFASATEIVVDDLSYDEQAFVQVIQDTDDQGEQALIIWIDDEAVL